MHRIITHHRAREGEGGEPRRRKLCWSEVKAPGVLQSNRLYGLAHDDATAYQEGCRGAACDTRPPPGVSNNSAFLHHANQTRYTSDETEGGEESLLPPPILAPFPLPSPSHEMIVGREY